LTSSGERQEDSIGSCKCDSTVDVWACRIPLLSSNGYGGAFTSTNGPSTVGRTGATAWQAFERMCAGDLQLLPVELPTFHREVVLSFDASPSSTLRVVEHATNDQPNNKQFIGAVMDVTQAKQTEEQLS
jgi:hypothetical protein